MLEIGQKLFAKIHKRKHHAHYNHEMHIMAREIEDWLPQGIQSMIDGSYDPRCLKRFFFQDEMVDQLHLSDRIFQHILLKQLKPTFPHVMNKNCYHLHGPTGVKHATQRIRQMLREEKPKYERLQRNFAIRNFIFQRSDLLLQAIYLFLQFRTSEHT